MKLTKFFVCGALACVLVLLELPYRKGGYLLVELEDTADAPILPMPKSYPIPPKVKRPPPGDKTATACNKFAYTFP